MHERKKGLFLFTEKERKYLGKQPPPRADEPKKKANKTAKATFDCTLEFETELPKGDKTSQRYDALSLVIIELDRGSPLDKINREMLR